MNSTINLISDYEDDDGIDWSEACREIDLACEAAAAFTSTSSGKPLSCPQPSDNAKTRNGNAKQSTLDKFVLKASPKPPLEFTHVRDRSGDSPAGVPIDPEAAKTWIYPVNIPLRDYQFAITKTALFSNTLVALPTGLGKTLIAAVVMYNYFRWFPDGKIVFAAPSRPLVMQQIEACHNIVGIPQEMTTDMTGLISPTKRACFWKSKRVFFVTPQVLEKDIQSGTCLIKHLVCLVIDEAHRAMGNYSSSVAVRELMGVPVQLRILALTATPGSKQQTVQQVIDNLHISTLEFRNESDPDVIKYVHNRKIELIQVAMGQDATDINEKLSDVMRPYLKKLSDWRVLQHRDDKTLSPCELLTLREKFRQAPPPNFSNFDSRDAEGYFGLLITLTHVRKLLLCHGIKPAHEMLEEKMKLGSFARYMSRNEDIYKAKLIMERSLHNGAPSPKLSKMLEVLLDHFKTKDPQSSRVIIFSNFRGSVSNIMDSLVNLGNCVRATQFIGQSSGKILKGQSQKVQQAVLEKFRAGGYNVIVATSIGEEGLDIMEVDLVICFDANVSPLRMIQRMGRTGRKHDGRVVVLACDGPELKGYMRKQANSKTIGKYMRNGGVHSFTFHSSPRMVPHIYKPEPQFIELSIEKFVRNGKKVTDDDSPMTPALLEKLTDDEKKLISKYFAQPGGITWKPSLIAFPHFQTFPSRVINVRHSYKTGVLIDTMQRLQGQSFFSNSKTSDIEDEVYLEKGLEVDNAETHENREDVLFTGDSPNHSMERKLLGSAVSTEERQRVCDFGPQSSAPHSYYFGSDFVTVDSFGNVLILSVPVLTFKEVSHPKNRSERSTLSDCFEQVSWHLKKVEDKNDLAFQALAEQNQTTPQTRYPKYGSPRSSFCTSAPLEGKTTDGVVKVSHSPAGNGNWEDRECVIGTPGDEIKSPFDDCIDTELSPRVTSMIKSGVVPESPTENNGSSNGKEKNIYHVLEPASPAQLQNQLLFKTSVPRTSSASIRGCTLASPIVDKSESPLLHHTNDSSSRNWCSSVREKSESVNRPRNFKRLRKVGDCEKNELLQKKRHSPLVPNSKFPQERGKKPINDEIRAFIDDEAEVSSDGHMSEDEDDDYQGNDSHDSFIDDRTCPTNSATQSATRTDMMAIYRRSLLSQSPLPRFQCGSTTSTHSSGTAITNSGKQSFSFRTPMTHSADCTSSSRDSKHCSSKTLPHITSLSSNTEGRKRKLSFCPPISVPAINLEQHFRLQDENSEEANCDDEFYKDIDFDAIEAQATLLLKQKSETSPMQKQEMSVPVHPRSPTPDFPSFDLGI